MKKLTLIAIFFCFGLFGSSLILDLTSINSFGSISGAIFQQGSNGSGIGNYVNFVQLRHNGTEQGYNSSYRPNQFNEGGAANSNRDIQLSDLAITHLNGQEYALFGLEVNESQNQSLISLDSVQIYISSYGDRTGYPNLGTMIYNMDASSFGNTVLLDSSLYHGNGTLDMMFYLPTSLLTSFSLTDYLYFYSSFGDYDSDHHNWSSSGGAEKWAISDSLPHYVPEPSMTILSSLALATSMLVRRRRECRFKIV